MVVTSVIGHLMELDVEKKYVPWSSCDPIDIFQVPVVKYIKDVCFYSLLSFHIITPLPFPSCSFVSSSFLVTYMYIQGKPGYWKDTRKRGSPVSGTRAVAGL